MDNENDNIKFTEDEIDNNIHNALVEKVLNLNKVQHVKSPYRTESSSQVSEFNLINSLKANQNLVHINELTKVLKGRKSLKQISNNIKSSNSKSQTLVKPLEKPQAERIKRSLNYEKSRLQFDRWEALVSANRAAAQLVFPLDSTEKVKVIEKRAKVYPSTFRIKSDLQKKLEELEPKVEEYHIDTEEKNEFPLTIEELKEKRKEAAKLRAHQSFKEAKARRQNKIKSKKYHRILRREKIKQQLKEFEELQKSNPDEALKRLEEIDKARAEERFSLRHKGTGQWAKNKQIRAKYDKESRQELAKQLSISRDLTKKLKSVDSESEDEDVQSESVIFPNKNNEEDNPWVNDIKHTKEVVDFVSGYRKYWNDKNQAHFKTGDEIKESTIKENSNTDKINKNIDEQNTKIEKMIKKTKKNVNKNEQKLQKNKSDTKSPKKIKKPVLKNKKIKVSSINSEWEVSNSENIPGKSCNVEDVFENLEKKLNQKINKKLKNIKNKTKLDNAKAIKTKRVKEKKIDLSLKLQKKKQIIDEEMSEQAGNLDENDQHISANSDLVALNNIIDNVHKPADPININPEKFVEVKQTTLNSAIPDILTVDENEDVDQRDIIMEAFEDDDITADFAKEKAAEVEKDTPKDIDLNLPGWGSWAGKGIKINKRKQKRFILKMPTKVPRRDDNKGSLIINEKAQSKIKPLLVSEVPFPFKSVKDYEASIRAPIGNTFVPEMAFRKFIEPSVVTKMGAIIEPINKGILMGVKKV